MLQIDDDGNSYDDGVYETDYGWDPVGSGSVSTPEDSGDNIDAGGGWNPITGKATGPSGGIGSDLTKLFNEKFDSSFTPKQLAGLVGVLGGGIAGLSGLNKPNMVKGNVGYQGGIPKLTATRQMQLAPPTLVPHPTGGFLTARRPGQGGVNYGGDVTYTPQGASTSGTGIQGGGTDDWKTDGSGATVGTNTAGVQALLDRQKSIMDQLRDPPYKKRDSADVGAIGTMDYTNADYARDQAMRLYSPDFYANKNANMAQVASQAAQNQTVKAAQGGIMGLAHGGRYLQGGTDGMADKLRTSIDGKQPAALSHGEFVIPADVVSHLGNGNSDAGAKKLYQMMDKIRQARTGTKKQGKQINPDKFMPGGLAQLAQGGAVQRFADGGVPAGTMGTEQTLAGWTGDYVPNMLAQGQALANAPYQQYQGPLTAGASELQNKAFTTAGNLATPSSIGTAANTAGTIANKAQGLSYTPNTATFGADQAKQYMNPYLQQSLDPQLAEARRQSDITAQQNNAQMTKAGAFGGGRQAILTGENQRNLGSNLANITGQGYNTAFTNAMSQFNADQARKMQENQFGANYGLQGLQTGLQAAQTQGQLGSTQNQADLANLSAQAGLGAQQRGIESEGIAADKAQFEAARDNPYKMLQFQQSLLNGLPISAQNYQSAGTSTLTDVAGGMSTVDKMLATLGLSPGQTGAAPNTAATKKQG